MLAEGKPWSCCIQNLCSSEVMMDRTFSVKETIPALPMCSVFATGSCDGTTRIWRYKEGGWVSIVLRVPANELSRYVFVTINSVCEIE